MTYEDFTKSYINEIAALHREITSYDVEISRLNQQLEKEKRKSSIFAKLVAKYAELYQNEVKHKNDWRKWEYYNVFSLYESVVDLKFADGSILENQEINLKFVEMSHSFASQIISYRIKNK